MIQALEEKPAQNIKLWMEIQLNQLIDQWKFNLDEEEKQVWLWNSLVEIAKIKQRRRRM